MNPSQSLRITTMMRAMQDAIIPAIGEDQPLAKEQAGLMLGHLAAMLQQDGQEWAVDDYCRSLLESLSDTLLSVSEGESGDVIDELRSQLAEARAAGDSRALSFHCERMLALSDVSEDFKRKTFVAVLHYAKAHTRVGRVWCLPMGFDSKAEELPGLSSILQAS